MSNTSGICRIAFFVFVLALACPASAKVTSVGKSGFEVQETAHINAKPDSVYYTLTRPARWWSGEHTFSGSASNLSMAPKAGGCWCERLPDGGSVQHLQVAYVKPDEVLRLRGALGPLQEEPIVGVLTFTLKAIGGGTDISMVYSVGGYSPKGFNFWSKPVDGVLADQLVRLKRAVETGSPDANGRR